MANYQPRTADWCIQRAFWHAFRKAAPASTSPKYLAAMAIADSMQKTWADEPDMEWGSLFQPVTLSTKISTATTVPLDLSINYVSKREGNPLLLTSAAGGDARRFELISPTQLYEYRYQDAAAQEGRNLVFSRAFDSASAFIGGTIQVPAYVFPPDILYSTDIVVVDNPMWLVFMIAAELVRNDVVKRLEYNNLLAMADNVMQKMRDANGGQRDELVTPWRPAGESWV